MRTTRGKNLGQQLAVADLVGVETDRVGGMLLRLIDAAERQQGAGAQLMGGVVPGSVGEQRLGQEQRVPGGRRDPAPPVPMPPTRQARSCAALTVVSP